MIHQTINHMENGHIGSDEMATRVLTVADIPVLTAEIAKHLKGDPAMSAPTEDFMTIAETGEWLGVTRQTIYQRIRAGHFKAYGRGTHHIRLRRSEVVAALKKMGGETKETANAHLMSASPDLLDALESICTEIAKRNDEHYAPEYEKAMTIISKAKGQ